MSRDIDAVDSVMAPEMVEMLARKEALQKDITQFRKDCDHTSAIRIPKCNVGNYDPTTVDALGAVTSGVSPNEPVEGSRPKTARQVDSIWSGRPREDLASALTLYICEYYYPETPKSAFDYREI